MSATYPPVLQALLEACANAHLVRVGAFSGLTATGFDPRYPQETGALARAIDHWRAAMAEGFVPETPTTREDARPARAVEAETELAALRARFDRESEIYENTKNDLRDRLALATDRAKRAERVVAQWDELRALLVDDPAEAARRLDAHRDQERWSREPEIDSRPDVDEEGVP